MAYQNKKKTYPENIRRVVCFNKETYDTSHRLQKKLFIF